MLPSKLLVEIRQETFCSDFSPSLILTPTVIGLNLNLEATSPSFSAPQTP